MNTPNSMGCMYVLKGLINTLTYQDVAKMIKEDIKWNIRPEKFIKSFSNKYNSMVVFSITPPPQRLVQFNGTSNYVEIEDFIPRKPSTKAIDKIFENYWQKNLLNANFENEPDDRSDDDNQADDQEQADSCEDPADITMTRDWFDMSVDHTMEAPAPYHGTASASISRPPATGSSKSVNQWEVRKANAIKAAAAQAEDKASKQFWQARKDEDAAAKTVTANDNEKFKEAIVSDTAKEFQRLKEQLVQQNLENDRKIKDMMDAQKQMKEQFDNVSKQLDEKLDGRLNDFFSTMNTTIAAQAKTFGLASNATNSQLNELQGEFGSLKAKLVDFMDNFGKKAAEKRDAAAADDKPEKKSRGSSD
jgi:hypothetical protein